MKTQAPKVVGHSTGGICGWVEAQQLSQVLSQLPMAKAVEMRPEHDQSREQRLDPPIVEAQGGTPLTVTLDWTHDANELPPPGETLEQANARLAAEQRRAATETAIKALFNFMTSRASRLRARTRIHHYLIRRYGRRFNGTLNGSRHRTPLPISRRMAIGTNHDRHSPWRVVGYALVAHAPAAHEVGYAPAHRWPAGSVMLDASSDIDGLNLICPWRAPVECPKATYDI